MWLLYCYGSNNTDSWNGYAIYIIIIIITCMRNCSVEKNTDGKNPGVYTQTHIYCCCCLVAKLCLTLCDPMAAACQASLSVTISRSLLKFMIFRFSLIICIYICIFIYSLYIYKELNFSMQNQVQSMIHFICTLIHIRIFPSLWEWRNPF